MNKYQREVIKTAKYVKEELCIPDNEFFRKHCIKVARDLIRLSNSIKPFEKQ